MFGKMRYLAPMLGACLMTVPATAQTLAQATPTPTPMPARGAPVALSAAETVWHMRGALNVAALACRGADDAETVQLYNAMLHDAAAALADAAAGTERVYRLRYAAQWQEMEDDAMTRLYNGFAAQTGHAAFCAKAHTVLRALSSVEPSDFANFAAAALAQLEAPFAAPEPIVEAIDVHTAPPLQVALLGASDGDRAPRRMAIAFAD